MNRSPYRLRCVVDASVLIDLERCGLLERLMRLSAEWMIPDLALGELRNPSARRLLELGFSVMSFSGAELVELIALRSRFLRLSMPDTANLLLAQRAGALLLTNDANLRRAAVQMHLRVHGTLWALDEMVRRGLLAPAAAAVALRTLLERDSRLPEPECRRRLKRWEGGQ